MGRNVFSCHIPFKHQLVFIIFEKFASNVRIFKLIRNKTITMYNNLQKCRTCSEIFSFFHLKRKREKYTGRAKEIYFNR